MRCRWNKRWIKFVVRHKRETVKISVDSFVQKFLMVANIFSLAEDLEGHCDTETKMLLVLCVYERIH